MRNYEPRHYVMITLSTTGVQILDDLEAALQAKHQQRIERQEIVRAAVQVLATMPILPDVLREWSAQYHVISNENRLPTRWTMTEHTTLVDVMTRYDEPMQEAIRATREQRAEDGQRSKNRGWGKVSQGRICDFALFVCDKIEKKELTGKRISDIIQGQFSSTE